MTQYKTVELTVQLIQKMTKQHLTFLLSYTMTTGGVNPSHCTTDSDLNTREERKRECKRESVRERERERERETARERKLFNLSKPPVMEAKNKNPVPI